MSEPKIVMTPYYADKIAQAIIDDEINGRLVAAILADRSPLADQVDIIKDEHKRLSEET